jgi:hypothetical protein
VIEGRQDDGNDVSACGRRPGSSDHPPRSPKWPFLSCETGIAPQHSQSWLRFRTVWLRCPWLTALFSASAHRRSDLHGKWLSHRQKLTGAHGDGILLEYSGFVPPSGPPSALRSQAVCGARVEHQANTLEDRCGHDLSVDSSGAWIQRESTRSFTTQPSYIYTCRLHCSLVDSPGYTSIFRRQTQCT